MSFPDGKFEILYGNAKDRISKGILKKYKGRELILSDFKT